MKARPPEKLYVSVKAAIWKEQRLLLQKEPLDSLRVAYDLPGGRIEPGEDLHLALKREVQEELGVDLHSISTLPCKVWSTKREDGVVVLLYEAKLSSEDFCFPNPEEVLSAEFMSLDAFQGTEDFIHKAFIEEYMAETLA